MVKTRGHAVRQKERQDERRQERVLISAATRKERLEITKRVAEEIVESQDSQCCRFGVRKKLLDKNLSIYTWSNIRQVDWHIIQVRKQKKEIESNNTNNANMELEVNNDLDVNVTSNNERVENYDDTFLNDATTVKRVVSPQTMLVLIGLTWVPDY